jgi:hypothetical protein
MGCAVGKEANTTQPSKGIETCWNGSSLQADDSLQVKKQALIDLAYTGSHTP